MAFQHFISSLLSKNHIYQQSDYVERHVGAVLQCTRGLTPEIDILTANSGVSSKLLVLRGVVPIDYRGEKYYIPVDIWLPESYPSQAPIVFVTPTAEMRVKPNHPSVDQSGHAFIPYLRLWNPTCSTLVELLSMLSVEFSNNPPVYRYNPKSPPPAVISQGQQYIRQNDLQSPNVGAHQSDITQAEQLVRDKLIAFVKDHTEYINGLISHQFEQKNGSVLLEKGMEKLIYQKEMLQKYKEDLRTRTTEVNDWCIAHTPTDPPSHETLIDTVDQRILPADIWSKQLFDEAANDFAIEDTLYVLDKFFQDGRIDLATYLKKVRLLARDQFFARAVCIKVESKQQQVLSTNHDTVIS